MSLDTIIKHSVSMSSIWQAIPFYFGFQSAGAHFVDLNNITRTPEECPEDLYKRLIPFFG